MNVVHSVDAYVLRSIHRRCNYDYEAVYNASLLIEEELIRRLLGSAVTWLEVPQEVQYYCAQYERSGMADVVILPFLEEDSMGFLTMGHLRGLATIVNGMLEYKPFEVVTIHDEFKCHPNNMNHLRQQYINVLAELADSNVLSDVLGQLLGASISYNKLSTNLSTYIKGSNYALS